MLPVDDNAAEQYAVIASSRERAGKPIAGFDALIAAVCRAHGATLATRNVPDFEGTGIEVVDPGFGRKFDLGQGGGWSGA